KVILNEEERFLETLADGLDRVKEIVQYEKEKNSTRVSGKDIFQLYDTYGFPVELTEEVVQEEGMEVDLEEFEIEMEKQRERARSARQTGGSMSVKSTILNDVNVESQFIGFESDKAVGQLVKIIEDDSFVESVSSGKTVKVLFDQTPFYAEKGGQAGDTGTLVDANNEVVAEVISVKPGPEGQPVHE